MPIKIGEIVEASTSLFLGETYELHQMPPFGSLVRASDATNSIYGLVFDAGTASLDAGRRPVPRGQNEENEEDIYRKNPQLAKLLRTSFSAIVVGYGENNTEPKHMTPPRPPRIHGFIYQCEAEEVINFTYRFDFLSLLASARLTSSTDELIAAFIRSAGQARNNDRSFLVKAGKELAVLLAGDLNRLNAILRRIRP